MEEIRTADFPAIALYAEFLALSLARMMGAPEASTRLSELLRDL